MGVLNEYRFVIFCPVAKRDEARALLSSFIPGETTNAFIAAFGDGHTVTHYAVDGVIDEDTVNVARGTLPVWANFFRWSNFTGLLLSSSEPVQLGTAWCFDACLNALQLQRMDQ